MTCRCRGHAHNALADRHPAPNGYCLQCPCTTEPSDPVAVVAEAIRWYGANPQAEASAAEVIVAALRDAGLVK
jgi:hypothetical protein